MHPDDARGSGRPHGGWIALSFVAGLLGGAAALALLPVARNGPADVSLSVSGLQELDRHVQELTREIKGLQTAPVLRASGTEPPTDSAVEPLHTSADADVRALIARLDELLGQQSVARTLGASGGAPPLLIPDPTTTEAARRALIAAKPEDVPSDCFLMTYQQIVERYGRPSNIWLMDDGVIRWTYWIGDDLNRQIHFRFVDGMVSGWN